jgi:hypothetical protein
MVRRLDDIARSVERLVNQMETSYVRLDVYRIAHEALRREVAAKGREYEEDIKDLKAARERDAAYRRQIMAGAAVGIILILVNLAIATSNLISRAG